MELDKRIKSIDDIQTIISNNRGSIGCKGFFFDNFVQAKDLTKTHYGTLVDIDNNDDNDLCFKARDKNGNDFVGYFRLFIPEDALKPAEKKYRPYTVMEFIKEYPLGSHLYFRPKDKLIEMHRLIDGYNDCLNGAGTLFMCGAMYSMRELYDNYEICVNGEWLPFGVIDEGE